MPVQYLSIFLKNIKYKNNLNFFKEFSTKCGILSWAETYTDYWTKIWSSHLKTNYAVFGSQKIWRKMLEKENIVEK